MRFAPRGTDLGVPVLAVLPGGPSDLAGLLPEDLLQRVDDLPVSSPQEASQALQTAPGPRALTVLRGEIVRYLTITLTERPMEVHPGLQTTYGEVQRETVRLRTIVTAPAGDGPFPAVVFLQGHGYQSVDTALVGESVLRDLLRALGRLGIGVVRSERRGVGDSEGGPPEAVPFATETEDHGAVLDAARGLPGIDPARVALFGHSLGGAQALSLGAERPWLAGVAVYGAGVLSWTEYLDQNARRHLGLAGADPVETERLVRLQQRLSARVLVLGQSLVRCLAEEPELAREARHFGVDPEGLWHGHPETYWQAVYALPTVAHATALRCPLLALWGALDHLSSREEHERLAQLAHGRFQVLPGVDHQLQRQPDARSAFEGRPGPLHPRVPEVLGAWVLDLGRG